MDTGSFQLFLDWLLLILIVVEVDIVPLDRLEPCQKHLDCRLSSHTTSFDILIRA